MNKGVIIGGVGAIAALVVLYSKKSTGQTPPSTGTVTPPTYTIMNDGGTIYAINGKTGNSDYSGTDAYTVIQTNVINKINTGNVFIKSGTYNLTNPLDTSNKAISITGEHRTGTILKRNSGDVITIKNSSSPPSGMQSVSNITLDGGDKSGSGLNLEYVYRNNFDNLNIINCNNGIYLRHTLANYIPNIFVHNCNKGMVFDTPTASGEYNHANVVVGGEINNGNPGVYIYGNVQGNKFLGVVIEGGQSTQVVIRSSSTASPVGNIFDKCWFETANVVSPIHVDIQSDTGLFPYSNFITNSQFYADQNYIAIRIPGNANQFNNNFMFGGPVASISVSGNDNVLTYNSCSITLSVVNTGTGNIFKGNQKYITENSGTSTGTGYQQPIPHGLNTSPTRLFLSNKDSGANAYESSPADSTYVYVTANAGLRYYWKAEAV